MRIPLRNCLKRLCGTRSQLLWAVLLLCLPAGAGWATQEDPIVSSIQADSNGIVAESNETMGLIPSDRRDVHAELPPDANLQDVLHAYADSRADALAGGLDTGGCPCRTEAPEEEAGGEPPPHPMGVIGLGFGSAILVLLAAFALWRTHTTEDSARP